jgi:glycosyltransferase involved in cell wall biosynthesis
LPQEGVLLGSVARLHPLKQLDAAIRLLPARPDWQLALAGQGPDLARLRQLAETLGVAQRVHFIGEIAPDQIGGFLAALDVFVFPSLAETFGLAAVEAAHAGIPVVANDLPVLREVLSVEGKPAALFVDAADTERFAATVATAVADPATREAVRQSALGLKTRYSVEAMVNDYAGILKIAMK